MGSNMLSRMNYAPGVRAGLGMKSQYFYGLRLGNFRATSYPQGSVLSHIRAQHHRGIAMHQELKVLADKLKADIGYEMPYNYRSITLTELMYLVYRQTTRKKLKRLTKYQAQALVRLLLAQDKINLLLALNQTPLPSEPEQTEAMLALLTLARTSLKRNYAPPTTDSIVSDLQNEYVTRQAVCGFSDKNFYKSREWRELRFAVLAASNRKCKLCGRGPADGAALHIDHIKPRSLYPNLSLSRENMQVLCGDCNRTKSNLVSVRF